MNPNAFSQTAVVAAMAFFVFSIAFRGDEAYAMNKGELIQAIASGAGLSLTDTQRAIDAFIHNTATAQEKAGRALLVGYGAFSVSAGTVIEPFDPSAPLPGGKPLKRPIKVRHRNGSRTAGSIALGPNGTWELVIGLPDASYYDETIALEIKMPKPIEPRLVELELRLPSSNDCCSGIGGLLGGAAEGVVVEVSLPPGTFDNFAFDPAQPDPDFHAAFYTSVHAGIATDPCVESVVADRLGFDGEPICPSGMSCALDATERDQLIVALSASTGLDGAAIAAFLDAIQTLAYPPHIPDADSLSGFGSFSVSQRAARTGRNPQTGKAIKFAAKRKVRFKAGADLSKKVN